MASLSHLGNGLSQWSRLPSWHWRSLCSTAALDGSKVAQPSPHRRGGFLSLKISQPLRVRLLLRPLVRSRDSTDTTECAARKLKVPRNAALWPLDRAKHMPPALQGAWTLRHFLAPIVAPLARGFSVPVSTVSSGLRRTLSLRRHALRSRVVFCSIPLSASPSLTPVSTQTAGLLCLVCRRFHFADVLYRRPLAGHLFALPGGGTISEELGETAITQPQWPFT